MIFITILTLIVAKALPAINNNLSTLHFTRISSLVLIFSAILSIQIININSIGYGIGLYSGLFHITQINLIFEIFILIIGGLILIGWPLLNTNQSKLNNSLILDNKENNLTLTSIASLKETTFEVIKGGNIKLNKLNTIYNKGIDYSIIILFSILGSILLLSSYDLISLYLSIELQSFGLYVLSTLHRDSYSSTASGLKYFLLGGFSSCIILLGIGLIYAYTGLTQYESLYLLNSSILSNIQSLMNISELPISIGGFNIGLILIFIGLLFKIAAAPLHNWSPDVYDGTPTIVTIYLTIIPKLSILILMLELITQTVSSTMTNILISNTGLINIINNISLINIPYLLLITSLFSLIIGSLLGLAQIKIKRLLAYSTISHIGFILLAISINTSQSIDSFLFYILQYTITNLNIFLIILAYSYIRQNKSLTALTDINYINEFIGLFYNYPLLSLSFSICLFSMAGIPPLVGFFSKQFVLYAALQNGYYLISIIAIIVSVISASYYLKIVKLIMTPNNTSYVNNYNNDNFYLSNLHSYLISSFTLFILLFFINPSLILNSTQLLSLSLFYI
jgi:NADH-ubiquinone oxidoreductase chain 2